MYTPLTEEQYNKAKSSGFSHQQIIEFEKQRKKDNGGFISRVGEDLKQRGQQITGAFKSQIAGKTTPLSTGIRTVGAVAGGITDVLGEGISTLTPEPVKQAGLKLLQTKIGQEALKAISAGADVYGNWKQKNPELAKDLEAVVNISTLLPVGKAGQVVGKTAIGAGEKIAKPVIKATGKTLATTGAIAEKTGKRSVSLLFPPNEGQIGKLTAYKAKTPLLSRIEKSAKGIEKAPITPADVALKYNLVGISRTEIAAKAKRVANDLWSKQVIPALKSIKNTYNKNEIFDDITKQISKISDPSRRKSLQKALDAVADDYKYITKISVNKLDKIKSDLSKRLPQKIWKGQDITGDANEIRKMMSDKMRQLVRKELPNNIKTIYDEYGSLLEIIRIGNKAYTQGSLKGGWLGGISEAYRVAGTPITTLGGKAISETGTALKKVGQKLINK